MDSNICGKKVEDDIEQFLIKHKVPYWRNLKVRKNNIDITELDFVIPSAIIECKCKVTSRNIDDLVSQLKKQLEYCKDMILYLYFDFSTTTQIEELQKYIIEKITDAEKVKIIIDLEEIKIPEPINSYVILDNYLLYPFINSQNIKGKIFIDKMAYYNTYLKMDEIEEKMLEDYKIVFFDKKTISTLFADKYTIKILNGVYSLTGKHTLIVSKKKCINKKIIESISEFDLYSKVFYYFLPEDNKIFKEKYPNKLIENITTTCVCGSHYIFIPKHNNIICSKRLKTSAE